MQSMYGETYYITSVTCAYAIFLEYNQGKVLDGRRSESVGYPGYFPLAFSAVFSPQLPTEYSGERKRKIAWIRHWLEYSLLSHSI